MEIYKPAEAWTKFLATRSRKNKWIENSKSISETFNLSNRELFSLIILASVFDESTKSTSLVGYDSSASEPNDGLIIEGDRRVDIESKLIPMMSNDDLSAIISTYAKYSRLGESYGKGRTLVIYSNKSTKHAIRISDLRIEIDSGECPFDSVLLMAAVAVNANQTMATIEVHEFYPGFGFASVNFNLINGGSEIEYSDFHFDGNILTKTENTSRSKK